MALLRLTYELLVEELDDGTYEASIGPDHGPLCGSGTTPILALRDLAERLADWSAGGSNRWLDGTPQGALLKAMFVRSAS